MKRHLDDFIPWALGHILRVTGFRFSEGAYWGSFLQWRTYAYRLHANRWADVRRGNAWDKTAPSWEPTL